MSTGSATCHNSALPLVTILHHLLLMFGFIHLFSLCPSVIVNIGNLAISNARYANRGSASFFDVQTALCESGKLI